MPPTTPTRPLERSHAEAFLPRVSADRVDAWALDLLRRGEIDPIVWYPVTVRGGLVVFVSGDGVSSHGVRLRASNIVAQRAADALGGMLPTAAIIRAAWAASPLRLDARPQGQPSISGWRAQYVGHEDAIARDVVAKVGGAIPIGSVLTRTIGKEYALGPAMSPSRLCFYGWQDFSPPDGLGQPSPAMEFGPIADRQNVIQCPQYGPCSGDHELTYWDYSHAITLVRRDALLDGRPVQLASVYAQSPGLVGHLPSERSPIPDRHPGVPFAGGVGV